MESCLPITRPNRSAEPTTAQEPIQLDDAKHQCKIPKEIGEHNEALQRLIVSARRQVETDCAIICYTGSFTWKQTEFPYRDFLVMPDMRPVTSITSIVYTATDGTSTTWGSSNYGLQNGTGTPTIALTYNSTWPVVRGDINGITVTFVAGYASVLVVPEEVRQAVLLQVNIQWNDYLEMDTAKMQTAYANHCLRIRRSFYG